MAVSALIGNLIFSATLPSGTKEVILALVNLSIYLKENFTQHFLIFMAEVLPFNWPSTLTALNLVSGSLYEKRALDI